MTLGGGDPEPGSPERRCHHPYLSLELGVQCGEARSQPQPSFKKKKTNVEEHQSFVVKVESPGSLLERNLRAIPDLVTQSLHFNKIPRRFIGTFKFGKPGSHGPGTEAPTLEFWLCDLAKFHNFSIG